MNDELVSLWRAMLMEMRGLKQELEKIREVLETQCDMMQPLDDDEQADGWRQ